MADWWRKNLDWLRGFGSALQGVFTTALPAVLAWLASRERARAEAAAAEAKHLQETVKDVAHAKDLMADPDSISDDILLRPEDRGSAGGGA